MLVTYESLSIIIVAYVVHEAHDASLKHSAGKNVAYLLFALISSIRTPPVLTVQ